jgi:hypothetical protein
MRVKVRGDTDNSGPEGSEAEEKAEDEIVSVPLEAASITPASDVVAVPVKDASVSVALPQLSSLIIGVALKVRGTVAVKRDSFNSPPLTRANANPTEVEGSAAGAMEQCSMDSDESAQWNSEV